ncbi:hypothetical protein DFS33DRAFT_1381437 [Desarmillaria ectypa]|nr:hypothetical protein DFS33DRAFT_1381437 [Desarmillaria ectypa]
MAVADVLDLLPPFHEFHWCQRELELTTSTTAAGYRDRDKKLKFMDHPGINVSVSRIYCNTARRHYARILWILLPSKSAIKQISQSTSWILDTRGVGEGLDDELLDPTIEATGLVILLHPHYGVDSQAFEKKSNGHVLASGTGVSRLAGRSPILCDSELIFIS